MEEMKTAKRLIREQAVAVTPRAVVHRRAGRRICRCSAVVLPISAPIARKPALHAPRRGGAIVPVGSGDALETNI